MNKQIQLILIMPLIFFSCSQTNEVSNEEKENSQDTIQIKEKQNKDTVVTQEIEPVATDSIDKCNFHKYLNDSKTPKLAKDIFEDREIDINNTEIITFLDSLYAKDKAARPFYFKVVTNSYRQGDGYYAEALGSAGKAFVENNTKEFVNYFIGDCRFSKNDLYDWVGIPMLELGLIADNEDKDVMNKFIKTLNLNCSDCSIEQRKILSDYIEQLENEWTEREGN